MALTITRSSMVTEIRSLLRDTGASTFWSDATIQTRLNRTLVRSPFIRKEGYSSLPISTNQVEFTVPTGFRQLRRAFFKDSSTPPNYIDIDEPGLANLEQSILNGFRHNGKFYIPMNMGSTYTLELFFWQAPSVPTADGDALDIGENQIDIAKYLTAFDLSMDDTRPISEAKLWRMEIRNYLDTILIPDAGVISTVE